LAVCGCGKPSAGNPVRGTVIFRGQPLDQGTIEFSPAAEQGTMSGGPIKDGQYQVSAEHGLQPGPYTVRIFSSEGGDTPKDEMPGEVTVPPKQRIPAEFNSDTSLKVEVQESGENRFDFSIP
jgi:hypothetical protein